MNIIDYHKQIYKLNFLLKSQWWSKEQLEELQLQGLKLLTNFARNHCPYYHELPKINKLADIKQLSILTKTKINKHFNDILVPQVNHVITTTGGTVSKITVAGDKRLLSSLGEQRFMNWYPIKHLVKWCYLWGSVEVGQQPSLSGNKLWLPVERLRTKMDALDYLKRIGHFKPDYLKAYAGSLYVLAQYTKELEKEKFIRGKVKVIATHCETLTSTMRNIIEEVFGCEVYNFYGSRDLGSQAQDCELHKDLHLYMERYIVEVVDGRFLFTDLLNYASPLIRYENQDVGELVETPCKCGRGLKTIKPLVGRVLNYLQTKSGDWITGFVVYLPIMYYDRKYGSNLFSWVEAYQIRQRKQGEITVLLKAWNHVKPPKDLTKQLNIIKKYAEDFNVKLEIVDSIPKSKTGKQLAVDTTLCRWKI